MCCHWSTAPLMKSLKAGTKLWSATHMGQTRQYATSRFIPGEHHHLKEFPGRDFSRKKCIMGAWFGTPWHRGKYGASLPPKLLLNPKSGAWPNENSVHDFYKQIRPRQMQARGVFLPCMSKTLDQFISSYLVFVQFVGMLFYFSGRLYSAKNWIGKMHPFFHC